MGVAFLIFLRVRRAASSTSFVRSGRFGFEFLRATVRLKRLQPRVEALLVLDEPALALSARGMTGAVCSPRMAGGSSATGRGRHGERRGSGCEYADTCDIG